MFVLRYLGVVVLEAVREWSRGMVLILALLPVLAALAYRVLPNVPHAWDNPALAVAVAWFVLLVLVIVPARIWRDQTEEIAALRGAAEATKASPFAPLIDRSTIYGSVNIAIEGHMLASRPLVDSPNGQAVMLPPGTVRVSQLAVEVVISNPNADQSSSPAISSQDQT